MLYEDEKDNVVPLFGRTNNTLPAKKATVYTFANIQARNKANEERLKRERAKQNGDVIRAYRLKKP